MIEVEPSQLELRDYLRILRRRWLVIIWTIIVLVALVTALSLTQQKVYEATAKILVKTPLSEQVSGDASAGNQLNAQRNVDTELEVLQSRTVKDAAAKRLGHAPDIAVSAIGQTDVVAVTASSTNPKQAASDAKGYALSYIKVRRAQSVDDLIAATNEIQARLNDVEARLNALPSDDPGRAALQTQDDFYRNQLSQFSVAAGVAQVGGGTLVTAPLVPSSPSAPTTAKNGLIAAFVGLILGIALAFLREYLDDSIKAKSDLERATPGVAVLGLVPATPGWKDQHQSHVVAREQPNSAAAESYRTLRTGVQFLGLEEPIRTLQVTSASSSEGKTTTLANLATTLAQAGQRVVVIDCDLRRPRIHDFFGLENVVGFTSVLLGEVPLSQAIQPSPADSGLAVLTSGPRPPDPSELLSLPAAARIFATLRGRCDILLIDSPPVLPVSDPLVISRHVDAILLVAKASVTSKRSLQRALEMLQQVDAPVAGTVLNDIHARFGSDAYQYSYGGYTYGGRVVDATNGSHTPTTSQREDSATPRDRSGAPSRSR
jgi:succinoglycan biosynthesis transport protein ExoP